jgi:hypothetical protein
MQGCESRSLELHLVELRGCGKISYFKALALWISLKERPFSIAGMIISGSAYHPLPRASASCLACDGRI